MGATNKGLSHSIRNRVCVRSYEFNVPILSPCYLARVQRVGTAGYLLRHTMIFVEAVSE